MESSVGHCFHIMKFLRRTIKVFLKSINIWGFSWASVRDLVRFKAALVGLFIFYTVRTLDGITDMLPNLQQRSGY